MQIFIFFVKCKTLLFIKNFSKNFEICRKFWKIWKFWSKCTVGIMTVFFKKMVDFYQNVSRYFSRQNSFLNPQFSFLNLLFSVFEDSFLQILNFFFAKCKTLLFMQKFSEILRFLKFLENSGNIWKILKNFDEIARLGSWLFSKRGWFLQNTVKAMTQPYIFIKNFQNFPEFIRIL